MSRALRDVHQQTGAKLCGLSAMPDVMAFTVDHDAMKDLELFILGTDGVWDGLRNQTAITLSWALPGCTVNKTCFGRGGGRTEKIKA